MEYKNEKLNKIQERIEKTKKISKCVLCATVIGLAGSFGGNFYLNSLPVAEEFYKKHSRLKLLNDKENEWKNSKAYHLENSVESKIYIEAKRTMLEMYSEEKRRTTNEINELKKTPEWKEYNTMDNLLKLIMGLNSVGLMSFIGFEMKKNKLEEKLVEGLWKRGKA